MSFVVGVVVSVGGEMFGVTLGVGPLNGVGVGEAVGAVVVVGDGVVVSLGINHVHVAGLNSVVLVVLAIA